MEFSVDRHDQCFFGAQLSETLALSVYDMLRGLSPLARDVCTINVVTIMYSVTFLVLQHARGGTCKGLTFADSTTVSQETAV